MGGGGSKQCQLQDHIDPKPVTDVSAGLTVAASQGCGDCQLTFPPGNTSSTVSLTRTDSALIIIPSIPLNATFNHISAAFTVVKVFFPSPLRVEGVQADAVVQFVSDDLVIFVPLRSTEGASGASAMFLSAISGSLDPTTEQGLGIKVKLTDEQKRTNAGKMLAAATGFGSGGAQTEESYATISVNTGQHWSIADLVSASDPYFTWVDSELIQYPRYQTQCDRYIGWKSMPGQQVIFFQEPVQVMSADITKLSAMRLEPTLPTDIVKSISNPLYNAATPDCPAPLPALKPPSFKFSGPILDYLMYFSIVLIAFFGVSAALVLANQPNSIFIVIGNNLARGFAWKS